MTFAKMDAILVESLHEIGDVMALTARWTLLITSIIIALAFIISGILNIIEWAMKKVKRYRTEKRCPSCTERTDCPAYNTGVIYPCPYYEKEDTQ